jgi:hypothetical protein
MSPVELERVSRHACHALRLHGERHLGSCLQRGRAARQGLPVFALAHLSGFDLMLRIRIRIRIRNWKELTL